jgi:hypothetical protein
MEQGQDKTPQRWTAKRRAALVVQILRGCTLTHSSALL